jgi:hypothetical protein
MVDEGFDLKWRNHVPEVFNVLRNLRDKEAFSDVLLYCDGEQFPAHKMMLAACSTFFERMLSNLPSEKAKTLVMSETRPDLLQLVLDFMYNGEVFVETSVLQAFMETAERLEVRGLRKSDDVAVPPPPPPPLAEIVSPRVESRSPAPVPVVADVKSQKPTKAPILRKPVNNKRPVRPFAAPREDEEERDSENNIGGERNGLSGGVAVPARKKLKSTISISGAPGGKKIFTGLPPGITIEPTGAGNERLDAPKSVKSGAIRVTAHRKVRPRHFCHVSFHFLLWI